MKGRPRTIHAGGTSQWTSGEVLGKCSECGDDACFYNEDAELMCDDCLTEFLESPFSLDDGEDSMQQQYEYGR